MPGRPVLAGLNLRIDDDDRIALLGTNGNGKSTFAKLVAGALPTEAGEITRAPKLKIGLFAQHQLEALDPAQSAYQHVRAKMVGRAGGAGALARGADGAGHRTRWRRRPRICRAARRRG